MPHKLRTLEDEREMAAPEPGSFDDLGLDPRLLRALGKKGYAAPTRVQLEVVPKVCMHEAKCFYQNSI